MDIDTGRAKKISRQRYLFKAFETLEDEVYLLLAVTM